MAIQRRLSVGIKHDHLAIMKKEWGLTTKILTGEKKVETRWYQNKIAPWDQIYPGDWVYFKDSGEPVHIKAKVERVEQYENLSRKKVIELLSKYAQADGLGVDKGSIQKFYHLFKNKKYCIVIYLTSPQQVESFEINKKGYGTQTAWLVVEDIAKIKR